MELKTIDQYWAKLNSIPAIERTPELNDLILILSRIKYDYGGHKLLYPLMSRYHYGRLVECLNSLESKRSVIEA